MRLAYFANHLDAPAVPHLTGPAQVVTRHVRNSRPSYLLPSHSFQPSRKESESSRSLHTLQTSSNNVESTTESLDMRVKRPNSAMTRKRQAIGFIALSLPLFVSSFQLDASPITKSFVRCQRGSFRLKRDAETGLSTLKHYRQQPLKSLFMSSEVSEEDRTDSSSESRESPGIQGMFQKAMSAVKNDAHFSGKLPPMQVDDMNLLFYDIVLIINLVVSIGFWVVHRMDFSFVGEAFNEGCLMSLLWIASGLYSGAFLNSAVDGHYSAADDRGGPKAAGLLGFQTFVNAVNLRLLFALIVAVLQHRPVGSAGGEQLLPLEIGFGLILMSFWRTLHSSFVPRV